MRNKIILLSILLCPLAPAMAQVSIGIGLPNVSIGVHLGTYPKLVPVPGYPVYYAPNLDSNYFFYDGLYWVYLDDGWYASSWYNGPWRFVDPMAVPLYVLRIPVRYYRHPPEYFRGWRREAPPRWDEHWGRDWAQQRSGWDHWNRNAAPARPPLPTYQRNYSGDRYPRIEQQQKLQDQHYRYQARDPLVRGQREQYAPAAPNQRETPRAPQERNPSNSQRFGNTPSNQPIAPNRPSPRNEPRGQQQQPQQDNAPMQQPSHQPRQDAGPRGNGAHQESSPQQRAEPGNKYRKPVEEGDQNRKN
ncbi:MAG: hypothetical protein P4L87_13795 [Formivibrio sp.]|nr:hypothetical protein [Formivibrio sp.]